MASRDPQSGPGERRSRDASVVARRRVGAVGALTVVIAVLVVIVVVAGHGGRTVRPVTGARVARTARGHRSSATTSASQSATRRRRVTPRPSPTGPLPVAQTSLAIVEPASASAEPSEGARALPTVVRYPAVPVSASLAGARPARGYPLVVFSQGFDEPAASYAGLLRAWAAAGYVVAAPTYPRTAPDAPGGLDESDILNHPTDLRYVIGAIIHVAQSSGSPLHGLVDAGRVAVAGQSDGGDVSLAVATNSCCRDPLVRAAVILSGAELASFGGSYFTSGSVPLLVVQGSADPINVPGCSALTYDQAPAPKYYLDLLGASHLPPYQDPGATRSGVASVVTAFLGASLSGHRGRFDRLLSTGDALPGHMQLSAGSTAPVADEVCPGAP